MTEYEAYQEHIRYTHDTYCRIVIRHASFDVARMLAARWKREISLEYLTEERSSSPHQAFSDDLVISMRQVLKKLQHEPHRVPRASITLNGATSTPIGQLKKWI
ncbi:hypothetical protein RJW51_04975 [Streptococcus parasuis]|uniref:hypothetical protein n=1 Tax=Streptococcus parasuis TaxID=1501662 RepID=UPI002088EBC0|nr:hypothetical protein RJW51_04975 [Streptococcus parasuis]BCP62642.1 hypothetical protein SUT380_18300 [Streptococcus parasuis]GIC32016.1 hypothetical protein SUT328_18430 [Streptococcus parasuis]